MAEISILMNGVGVRATLNKRKTQTRRLILPQPTGKNLEILERSYGGDCDIDNYYQALTADDMGYESTTLRCPFGGYGDFLYVRETWCKVLTEVHYTGEGHGGDSDLCCGYRATMTYTCGKPMPENPFRKWKPSIHMPKKRVRLWLVNEGTGVEQVQDISKADAIAEGIQWSKAFPEGYTIDASEDLDGSMVGGNYEICSYDAIQCFSKLWDSIYANPRPVRIKGVIDHYVSYPWDDIREVSEHRGKLWFIIGNAWLWKLRYRIRENSNK